MDGKLKSIHGAWISANPRFALPAGMTILDCVIMKSDKIELVIPGLEELTGMSKCLVIHLLQGRVVG
jgi:hypothetical protein